ncbi:uncharacterized protein LOC129946704 [Eupeodes corollae]|uniref:uncharacterized protein LOC129946704 n=1 Tax=Eupeodes corollae TaxID=290404 RepID=UPI00249311B9|nr:uncharacterized protein LOC129946704 [Eupeodes corollae]
MRFKISCVMENNNIKSTHSFHKQKKLRFTKLPMTKCCISGCPAITDSLVCFPPKHTEEYSCWLRACKESEANIIFKQNPMICVLHFRSMDKMPIRYVTAKDLAMFNDDVDRVNHCVTEWLLLARRNVPDITISDDDVLKKAKEIGRVYQLPYFEFHDDFGWIKIFANYLQSREIEMWNPKSKAYHMMDNNSEYEESSMIDDGEPVPVGESIRTYDEALSRVKILYSYCKRTQNKSALDLIERLNHVLKKRV